MTNNRLSRCQLRLIGFSGSGGDHFVTDRPPEWSVMEKIEPVRKRTALIWGCSYIIGARRRLRSVSHTEAFFEVREYRYRSEKYPVIDLVARSLRRLRGQLS